MMSPPQPLPRSLLASTFVYLVFVIYGSWVPLNFSTKPLGEALRQFAALPFADQAITSATDWATNCILLIPFTFLLGYLIRLAWPGLTGVISLLLASLAGVALAIFLEFTQLYFPPRIVSQKDLLALSLGGGIGATAQLRWGEQVAQLLDALWRSGEGKRGLLKFLRLYVLVVLLFSILPLDLTISVVEIYHKWREGRLILVPFSSLKGGFAEVGYELGTDLLIWLPVGLLLAMERRTSPLQTAIRVGLLALGVELAQLFVYSRVTDVSDPLLAALGGSAGAYLANREQRLIAFMSGRSSVFWFCAWLAWALSMLVVFWYPFDFSVGPALTEQVANMLTRLPFLTLFEETEFHAANEIIRKIVLFIPGGILCGAALSRSVGLAGAGLPCLMIWASLIEAGQLFLPGKVADTTDILLLTVGGWLGLRLFRAFRVVKWTSPPSSPPELPRRKGRMNLADGAIASSISPKKAQFIAFVLLAAGFAILTKLPGVPYNIKELIAPGTGGVWSVVGLSLTLLWLINGHFLAIRYSGTPFRVFCILPLWLLVHALVTWILLRLSVPMESIHDIVGSPVLDWVWEFELIGRYVALHSAIALPMLGALILTTRLSRGGASGRLTVWFILMLLLAGPLHAVIVGHAATDNLTELMREHGSFPYFMLLIFGVFFASLTATLLASLLVQRRHVLAKLFLIFLALIGSVACLWFGAEPMILKYGTVFSAWQFLLSSDRNHYIEGAQLWIHFAGAFAGYVFLVVLLQYVFWKSMISQPSNAKPARQRH
ncbi:MAG: VanZ family protein [Azonexus sp.]